MNKLKYIILPALLLTTMVGCLDTLETSIDRSLKESEDLSSMTSDWRIASDLKDLEASGDITPEQQEQLDSIRRKYDVVAPPKETPSELEELGTAISDLIAIIRLRHIMNTVGYLTDEEQKELDEIRSRLPN